MYETALAAMNAQKAAEGAQQQATQELKVTEKDARDAYQALAKVSRAIFKNDPSLLTALGLKGSAPPSLSEYGYDGERLASEKGKITAFDLANQKQEAAKGTTQQATREQNTALTNLDAWYAQYLKIARVALRGKKQLLEKIGVAARTSSAL